MKHFLMAFATITALVLAPIASMAETDVSESTICEQVLNDNETVAEEDITAYVQAYADNNCSADELALALEPEASAINTRYSYCGAIVEMLAMAEFATAMGATLDAESLEALHFMTALFDALNCNELE